MFHRDFEHDKYDFNHFEITLNLKQFITDMDSAKCYR